MLVVVSGLVQIVRPADPTTTYDAAISVATTTIIGLIYWLLAPRFRMWSFHLVMAGGIALGFGSILRSTSAVDATIVSTSLLWTGVLVAAISSTRTSRAYAAFLSVGSSLALLAAGVDAAWRLLVVLALTTNFEVNLLAARLAREEFGIREVHVATGPVPHQSVDVLLQRYEVSALGPGPVDVDRWSAHLDTGDATTTTIVVGERVDPAEMFERLQSGRAGLPVSVRSGDEVLPFAIVDQLRAGDRVTVVVRPADRAELEVGEQVG